MKRQDYRTLLKYLSVTFLGSSAGWVYYQIKKTKYILENAVDTSVLDLKLAPFTEENSQNFIDLDSLYPYEKNKFLKNVWDSIKFSYARRLVRVANCDDKEYRIKAVRCLAKVKNLSQWHCSLLANMIDPRTAVALARFGDADSRLLIEPPLRYHNYNKDMLINAMRDFLIGLYARSNHPCLGYFLSKVFVYEHDNFHIVDNDSSTLELSKFIQSEEDILPKCLESLLHHTTLENHMRDIVDLNGLPLLMEIHHRYKDNININMKLCQILSFMSFNKNFLEPIHKSGWIGILSQWVRHEDVRISVPAARALANLDFDENNIYARRLYLLHPLLKQSNDHLVDVVFVHGLLGGVFYTWRQRTSKASLGFIGKKITTESFSNATDIHNILPNKPIEFLKDLKEQLEMEDISKEYEFVLDDIPVNTQTDVSFSTEGPFSYPANKFKNNSELHTRCWPKDWLAKDCNYLRLIGIDYSTSLSMWASICPSEKGKFTLDERGDDLLSRLILAGLGNKPIVWITHSMGGLIVKNILCKAFESKNPQIRNVCLNTKGIVFYSTPHNGSRLANLNQATALLLWPSVEVRELRENSPNLKKMHEQFLEIVKAIPMKIVTFVETKSTIVTAMKFNFLLVEPKSANPGVGEYFEVPQDHLGICKPLSKCSFLYQKVLHMLQEVTEETRKNQKEV